VDDLIAFLRARFDEDEQVARAAHEPGGWQMRFAHEIDGVAVTEDPLYTKHIARWDPARVMAEVEAKRRALGLVLPGRYEGGYGEACLDVLRLLALPYIDHPDYRNEWRSDV
jgi:hypothetical protein